MRMGYESIIPAANQRGLVFSLSPANSIRYYCPHNAEVSYSSDDCRRSKDAPQVCQEQSGTRSNRLQTLRLPVIGGARLLGLQAAQMLRASRQSVVRARRQARPHMILSNAD